MITERIAAATENPITLDEAKAHLRVDTNADDALISSLISAAVSFIDYPGALGKVMVTQTWRQSVSAPDADGRLYLTVGPVQSISGVSYFDADNQSQAASVGDFQLYKSEDWAFLAPKSGKTWPVVYNRPDAISITHVSGYGAASAVPQSLKTALLFLVAYWYEFRGDEVSEMPPTAEALINMHKIGFFG